MLQIQSKKKIIDEKYREKLSLLERDIILKDGQIVTVDGLHGKVYDGKAKIEGAEEGTEPHTSFPLGVVPTSIT